MLRPTLLSLALALPAWGADPPPAPVVPVARISAPASVPAGTPIEVRSTGSLSVKPLKFKLISPKGVPFEVWVKADNSETMGVVKAEVTLATPGPFKFALVATGTEDSDFDFAEVAVAPVAPAPAPVPAPVPAPPTPPAPAPAPVAGHLHVTLFFDVNDTSVVAFRADPGLKAALAALDCDWYALATTSPAAKPYLAELAADGSPVVLVQGDDGHLLKGADGKTLAIKAPKSPADLIARVQSLRSGVK